MNRGNCLIKFGFNIINHQSSRSLWITSCSLNQQQQQTNLGDYDLPPFVHPSLSYAQGRSTKPFTLETLSQLLDERASKGGNRIIYTSHHENKFLSTSMLRDGAHRLALILHHELGINKGDMIGIWSLNITNWVLIKFAADYLGAVLVTINPYYKTDELAYLIDKSKCKILFLPGENSTQLDYNNFTEIVQSNSFKAQVSQTQLRHLFFIDGTRKQDKYGDYSVFTFDDFPESKVYQPIDTNHDPDQPSCLMFTSGTTGKPKGALLSSFAMINDCDFASDRLGIFDGDEKICCPLPFFHSFAFTHALVTSVVRDTPIEFCLGGALSDPGVIRKIKSKIPSVSTVLNGYGSTELSPAVTLASWNDDEKLIESTVGRPLPYTEVKIVDPITNKLVKHNEKGEIRTRGFNVMLEYFNDEQKTKETITPSGWYLTGDLGQMDENGFLKIVGRIKELIIRGGENIYPQEVENILMSHPKIIEAHVFGIPDERYGEEICSWVTIDQTEPKLTTKEIRDFLKSKLTYFKVPRHISIVKDFPMTSTFKVSKLIMREKTIELMKQSTNN
ncbi:medium-chain acyl-CoA ligase ACSF2, mitochondrial-like isoform X2 [Panonychus citri]|uniref:medium-chain acyl-CoA ligase ACSF2, mitochondrial-like isoform X2 n=1 Tax=Panonychus citri TaxID=50023 RepID=UPI0023075400|nr:medium-chain acyl-CoA ligase ACSF2, mitochondrial-like isoform X2 [Panonychus citri]